MENYFNYYLEKLRSYCAYQDRCTSEVITKISKISTQLKTNEDILLANGELSDIEIDELIDILKDEKFLDEVRFAESYTRGKFNGNQWGKQKIRLLLLNKKVPAPIVYNALDLIDPEAYRKTLTQLLQNKKERTDEPDPYKMRAKMFQFASNKGYESELIYSVMGDLFRN